MLVAREGSGPGHLAKGGFQTPQAPSPISFPEGLQGLTVPVPTAANGAKNEKMCTREIGKGMGLVPGFC